jgi:hypothetical protein
MPSQKASKKSGFERKFKNTTRTREGEPLIGKKSYFLNPKAAKDLFMFTESFVKNIGFDVIVLQADSLSLAVKVYGPWGYYPVYKTNRPGEENQINEMGVIRLLGDKVSNVQTLVRNEANRKRLINCDTTFGPLMFKFINTDNFNANTKKQLIYNWTVEKKMCQNSSVENNLQARSRKQIRKYGTFSGGKTRHRQK